MALSALVHQFESQFSNAVVQWMEEEKQKEKSAMVTGEVLGGWNLVSGSTGNHTLSFVAFLCCLCVGCPVKTVLCQHLVVFNDVKLLHRF